MGKSRPYKFWFSDGSTWELCARDLDEARRFVKREWMYSVREGRRQIPWSKVKIIRHRALPRPAWQRRSDALEDAADAGYPPG